MKKKILKAVFVLGSTCVLAAITALGFVQLVKYGLGAWEELTGRAVEAYQIFLGREVTRSDGVVNVASPSVRELIKETAKKHGVPSEIVEAVIHVESGTSINPHRVRFEPKVFSGLKEVRGETDIERRMRASSHGLMQVMGYNASLCGLKWPELYQPVLNLECGLKILKSCLERHKTSSVEQQYTKAFGCYNGDPVVYPAKVKAALADLVIAKLSTSEVVVAENRRLPKSNFVE